MLISKHVEIIFKYLNHFSYVFTVIRFGVCACCVSANVFSLHILFLQLVKGDTPIEIRTPPVVVVSLTVTVSFEDFFSPEALLSNLAFVLEIPLSSIRQINVIEEDSPLGRRKRQVNAGNGTMEITLELGSAPKNISTPGVSTVEEQLNNTSTDSVDDGSSQDVSTKDSVDSIDHESTWAVLCTTFVDGCTFLMKYIHTLAL